MDVFEIWFPLTPSTFPKSNQDLYIVSPPFYTFSIKQTWLKLTDDQDAFKTYKKHPPPPQSKLKQMMNRFEARCAGGLLKGVTADTVLGRSAYKRRNRFMSDQGGLKDELKVTKIRCKDGSLHSEAQLETNL